MAITSADAVRVALEDAEIDDLIIQANEIAASAAGGKDLQARDYLEKFINVLLGEIAEFMVIKWLQSNGKSVESGIDKTSGEPDDGHDLIVVGKKTGQQVKCSVKSSLSAKFGLDKIIGDFRLATERPELRAINIQVYFWLEPDGKPRLTVPSADNAAIIGWLTEGDVEKGGFAKHETEDTETPEIKLKDARSMQSLLDSLV